MFKILEYYHECLKIFAIFATLPAAVQTPSIPPRSTKPLPTAAAASTVKIVGASDAAAAPKNLRKIDVPTEISDKFLQLSAGNNRQNIETCGLLFGISQGDAFIITHCMLPKQTGTHDSCVTTNEEQIWQFQGEIL